MRRAVRVRTIGWLLAALGLLGIGAGYLTAWASGMTESDLASAPLGGLLGSLFSALFVVGTLIVLPISSLLRRRALRTEGTYRPGVPIAPDDLEPHQPELPPWLGWPLWGMVAAGSMYLIYMLLVHAIPEFFRRG